MSPRFARCSNGHAKGKTKENGKAGADDPLPLVDDDGDDEVEGFKIETRNEPAPKAASKKRDGSAGRGRGGSSKKVKASSPAKAARKETTYVGKKIAKYFDGEAYSGTVTQRRGMWWHVVYEDGDQEDLNPEDIGPAADLFNELATGKGWSN